MQPEKPSASLPPSFCWSKGLALKTEITAELVRQLLNYDPMTGQITRRIDGSVATHAHPRGYLSLNVKRRAWLAHRLVWLYMTGRWPEHQIDHINGVRTDNRWANLRDVTATVNYQNQRIARSNNRSCGLLGVTWDKSRGKWKASIRTETGDVYLGRFDDAETAHQAYLAAKRRFHVGCTI